MNKAFFVSVTLAAVSSLLYANQQRPPQQTSKPSIEIAGMTLRLGMAKADVAELFVGTQITKIDEQTWMIGNNGTVQFKNGKMIFGERAWMNDSGDQIDAIFKAVSSLNREGFSACRVLSDTPAYTERVGIDCGQKSVPITKTISGNQRLVEVSERLGDFELDDK
jgi:hypothetical protein